MITKILKENNKEIAMVSSDELIITDVQSALDFIATVSFETGCNHVMINKLSICDDFFDLKTQLAGEILQKMINYNIKIAIVGDFSVYTSKSLRDFIYECNHGKDIFFISDERQAIEKLSFL